MSPCIVCIFASFNAKQSLLGDFGIECCTWMKSQHPGEAVRHSQREKFLYETVSGKDRIMREEEMCSNE